MGFFGLLLWWGGGGATAAAVGGLLLFWSLSWWLPTLAAGWLWARTGRRLVRERFGLDAQQLMADRGLRWRWYRGWAM